jgi:hypothetical protein
MPEDIVQIIKNKMNTLSNTINNKFDISFLFEDLFPRSQSLNENKDEITMEIFPNDNRNAEMNYVALINKIDETSHANNKKEAFTNNVSNDILHIPNDILTQIYFTSLGALGIYILYGVMKKSKLLPV